MSRCPALAEELDFWDPRGSALVLAAERGQISSCLRLLHAGATATEADLAMARIAKAEIVTLCQLRPEELEELMNISKVGEDEMQQILRRKHRERISVGDADEDVKANSKASNLYEVCYSSVWIRREPHVEAAQVSKRIKGQQLNIEDRSVAGIPFLGVGWNVEDQNKKARFSSQAGTIIQTKCMQVLQERLFKFGSGVYTVKTRNLYHFGVALQSLSLPPVLPCKEFDESGEWGRVVFKTSEGMDEGVAWKVEPPERQNDRNRRDRTEDKGYL